MYINNVLYLKIGSFVIAIGSSDPNLKIYLSSIYSGFLIKTPYKIDLTIIVRTNIPSWIAGAHFCFAANKINSSNNLSEAFWNIAEYCNKTYIITYDQLTSDIAIVSELKPTNKIINLYVNQKYTIKKNVDAFHYPMGTLILYYQAINNNSIFLHGCGLKTCSECYIFTGVSGNGKTTISKLFNNSIIINDDRLIIVKNSNKYIIHNSPMYSDDMPVQAELSKIFLISHSHNNYHRQIKGAEATAKLYALTIQHNFDKESLKKNIDFVKNLTQEIPIYELGFIPNHSIVNYINEYVH